MNTIKNTTVSLNTTTSSSGSIAIVGGSATELFSIDSHSLMPAAVLESTLRGLEDKAREKLDEARRFYERLSVQDEQARQDALAYIAWLQDALGAVSGMSPINSRTGEAEAEKLITQLEELLKS